MSKYTVSIQRAGFEPVLHNVDSLLVAGELLAGNLDACAVVRGPSSYTVANRLGGHSTRSVEGALYTKRHHEGCACTKENDEKRRAAHIAMVAWDYDYAGATGVAVCSDGSLKQLKARKIRAAHQSYYEIQNVDGTWRYCGGSLPKETVVRRW